METIVIKRIYEAMFLFDPLTGNNNKKVQSVIQRLLDRIDGELILIKKWDERKLAYEIKKQKRGVYWLVFFKAPPANIERLERDIQIDENVLRALVIRHDKLTEDKIKQKYGKEPTEVDIPSGESHKIEDNTTEDNITEDTKKAEDNKEINQKEKVEQPAENENEDKTLSS